jgi:alkanesulfonate monooxygenase SsuD/methylene tetrahydromethanopterin reductase-like flavin-dependent oxidoreductase (luciferase family)
MVELASELRWQDKRFSIPVERIALTEKLGYDAVFSPEGFGSEVLVPLGYLAATTKKIKIGTRILQVTGRPPAVAISAYQTINHLTGGNRLIAGLGSGTPMQREGFEGRPWGNPVKRMRDYVTLLRQGFAGQPLDHQGAEWSAPYRGPDSQGLGPLTLGLEPISPIPIMIAASHPQMIALAAEISEGFMPPSWGLGVMHAFKPMLEKGFARAGKGKSLKDFKIWAHVDCIVNKDVKKAMRPFKEYTVHWAHLQREIMEARGYKELADKLRDMQDKKNEAASMQAGGHMLEGKLWEEAVNSVPDEYVDGGWLVGPLDRIRERAKAWYDCGLTGIVVRYGDPFSHETMVEPLELYEAVAKARG